MKLSKFMFFLFFETLVNASRNEARNSKRAFPVKAKRSHLRLIPSDERDDGQGSFVKSSHVNAHDGSKTDNEMHIPPPLHDLSPEHKRLYERALSKDYDYAQFGQPCKVYTVDELEGFLEILKESIEPKEDESDLVVVVPPEEKGRQLVQIFDHSRAICDFRNLLTCDKHTFTCACAHPSMGLNREGVCGINIGHPCEISEGVLTKHGVLMIPETSPVKCNLENAECVMESNKELFGEGISPIRKICRCQPGFWGSTCNRHRDHIGRNIVSSKDQVEGVAGKKKLLKRKTADGVSEEVELGRPIWMTDVELASSDYFMHPEEVRDKLLELMEEKNMFFPEKRMDEANKLVKNMEIDVDKEEMVINDLYLRELARLKHGESCDPVGQVVLDNPPVAKDATTHRWIDPHPNDIKFWQLSLLQQQKPLCNMHKLLRCNEATKVCECKSGLELDSKQYHNQNVSLCRIPLGHNCNEDFDPILEFNPLKDKKRFSDVDPPSCIHGTECTDKPFFFQKKCWCSTLKGRCEEETFDETLFSKMIMALQSRFTLKLGDSCDPPLHQRLLNYKSGDDTGFEKRLTFLREIIDNPESRLCDIRSFLNCSEASQTCECWKQLEPSVQKDGETDCVAINMASCGRTFKYGKYMFLKDGAQLWEVEKVFKKRFLPDCVPGAFCTGGNIPEWAGRCLCVNPNKTGETCGNKKSALARAFRASHIPHDDKDEIDLLHIYFDLNVQTVLMEQLMTDGINNVCDPNTGLTLDRIMKFWRAMANSSNTEMDRQALPYFIAVTKLTKYLVGTVHSKSASLCNATVGLRCHRTTGRCGCHRGARWIGNKCYLNANELCNPKPGVEWEPSCMPGTKCMPVKENRYSSFRCTSCLKKKSDGQCAGGKVHDRDEEVWDVADDNRKVKRKRLGKAEDAIDWNDEIQSAEDINIEEDVDSTNSIDEENDAKSSNVILVPDNSDASVSTSARQSLVDKSGSIHKRQVQQQQQKQKDDELSKRQRDAYVQEIRRMLKEILEYRSVPFGDKCSIDDEGKLVELFPTLPVYDLDHLSTSIEMAYIALSRLYWKGISFCNRDLFLKCTSEAVCGCSFGFGLVEEDGECRLKERSYCDRALISAGKRSLGPDFGTQEETESVRHPLFMCRKGTTCTQIDYGLPVCVRSNDWGGVEKEGNARHLHLSNDDDHGQRSANEIDKEQSGCSWTHAKIYFLGIAVVVRIVITWAFV